MKFSGRIERCALSPIRKFHPYVVAAQAQGKKVYHLNIGQPDVPTPRAFFDAIGDFRESVLAYAPSPGVEVYLDAVKDYYCGLGFEVGREDILATYGGSEALQIVLSCILGEGDEILVPEPFYPNYMTFVNVTGAAIRPIPTSGAEGYRFAFRDRIELLINDRTRAIMVTNPGNPTGVVLSKEEMGVLVDIAKKHDLFLIGDEVYRELVYGDEPLSSFLEFTSAAENIVVVDSISKRFSATGARVGAILSRNHELLGHALKICQGRLCAATLDQIGAAALYRALGEGYYAEIREQYRSRRDAVVESLKNIPGAEFRCPEGAFYLMVKLPVDDAEKLQYFLLQEFDDGGDTVMYAPGEGFYATPGMGKNEIRIAYVTKEEDLRRAIELLGLGIAAYNKKQKE